MLTTMGTWAGAIGSILTVLIIIIKPIRRRLFGLKAVEDGQRCMLRSDMLRTYYKHIEDKQLRQYEYENFMYEYAAYKALGGNSFIDHTKSEVESWEVIER